MSTDQTHDARWYFRYPSQFEVIGLFMALVPFLCSLPQETLRVSNGTVLEYSYFDLASVIGGGVAIVTAIIATLLLRRTADRDRMKRIFTVVVLLGLGALHVATGLGLGATAPPIP